MKPATPLHFSHRNLPQLLLQAREVVLARFRPLLNEAGFTEQQWRIVRALVEFGPMEPRQIVPLCGISSPSLAGILARMEETGLVKRERLTEDQRRVRVSPTARSRNLAARMAPRIAQAYAALEQELGSELTQQLYAGLGAVLARLGPPDGTLEPEATTLTSTRTPTLTG